MALQDPLKPTVPPAAPAQPEACGGCESTLMAGDTSSDRANSPLYKDDKKFPGWVWPVGIVVLVVLWWVSR